MILILRKLVELIIITVINVNFLKVMIFKYFLHKNKAKIYFNMKLIMTKIKKIITYKIQIIKLCKNNSSKINNYNSYKVNNKISFCK